MEAIGALPVVPSARIGGLMALLVACLAGTETAASAQSGDTGWTVSVLAGSLFGGDLEPGTS